MGPKSSKDKSQYKKQDSILKGDCINKEYVNYLRKNQIRA